MAVDILPTALPREASVHFSNVLMPYLHAVIGTYRGEGKSSDEGMVKALERATIANSGVLREEHRWLEEPLAVWKGSVDGIVNRAMAKEERKVEDQKAEDKERLMPQRKKKVVMFGSGMVAAPAVDEISRHGDVELIVGTSASYIFCVAFEMDVLITSCVGSE